MQRLVGNMGIGHVRYPTAGSSGPALAQPFYVNSPYGVALAHNGNLTNAHALKQELFQTDHRHINTESDSEVLLNVLAHELEKVTRGITLKPADVFAAVRGVHQRIKGSYAVVALIAVGVIGSALNAIASASMTGAPMSAMQARNINTKAPPP